METKTIMNEITIKDLCLSCTRQLAKVVGGALLVLSALFLVGYGILPLWQLYRPFALSDNGLPGFIACGAAGLFSLWALCVTVKARNHKMTSAMYAFWGIHILGIALMEFMLSPGLSYHGLAAPDGIKAMAILAKLLPLIAFCFEVMLAMDLCR
jgi:hypothetical protein